MNTFFRKVQQIVGELYYPFGKTAGFLLGDGVYTPLQLAGSNVIYALGINDAGQIVGVYARDDGTSHGFLATPVPEPATIQLLSIVAITLTAWWSLQRGHRAYGM